LLRLQISAEPGAGMSQAAIRFSFRNLSGDTLLVQRDFALTRKSESPASLWLEVTRVSDGSTPKQICASTSCKAGPPAPPTLNDYVELDPGEEFSTPRQLGCTFALPDAGPWRIVAHYRDKSPGPPPQRDDRGLRWFNGGLDSNALELTVPPIEALQESLNHGFRSCCENDTQRLPQLAPIAKPLAGARLSAASVFAS
jgi:hypothetical protein